MSGDGYTRCGKPEVGAAWSDFYSDLAPIVEWGDDVGPRDHCPDCATGFESARLAAVLGNLVLTIGALEDPDAGRPHEDLCARIDSFIAERIGDGDPR